jgi:hypothetical protein
LGRLAVWQKLWIVLAVLWIPGPVALLWKEYPRADPWRQAFVKQRLDSIEAERDAATARMATECTPAGDKYDMVSPKRRIEFLICMQERKGEQDAVESRYLKAKAALNDEAEQSVGDELPRAQLRVVGKGLAFWLAPVLSLFALGFAIARVRRAAAKAGAVSAEPPAPASPATRDPSVWARPRE